MSPPRREGFTLLEVMIALAILAMALVSLLVFTANNVSRTAKTAAENVAVDLARGKIYDLEEDLLDKGFQDIDQPVQTGDFDEEGWPDYSWEAKVNKVKLPDLTSLQGLGAAGADPAAGPPAAGLPGSPAAMASSPSPLAGLLGGMGGGAGAAGAGGMGDALVTSQFELIRSLLEQSIRKITLTVRWTTGLDKQELAFSYYLTDPKVVNRVVPASGPVAGDPGGGDPGGGGEDGGGNPDRRERERDRRRGRGPGPGGQDPR